MCLDVISDETDRAYSLPLILSYKQGLKTGLTQDTSELEPQKYEQNILISKGAIISFYQGKEKIIT